MSDQTSRDSLIALALLPFLTPARTRTLLERFSPAESACNASSNELERLLRITPAQASEVQITLARRQALATPLRDRCITTVDSSYPCLLREIADPPPTLFFEGDLTVLATPMIAVVGSRVATHYAINAARQLSSRLCEAGVGVVSGLARGVDAAAHASALEAGGKTIAVLGSGIDVVYPRSNDRLFHDIAERGLILSEFPPATPPHPANFPVRNRVISGLAHGTIIVEATSRSGSLITARMAAEQGREVFAVPGSIFSPGSEGAHRLIQYGAKLVHDVDDVLDEFPALSLTRRKPAPLEQPDARYLPVLGQLRLDEAVHIDDLVTATRLPHALAAELLLELELAGWIRAVPGARYVRAR